MTADTRKRTDRMVDDASEDSFPASDPPAHSGITGTGRPNLRGERRAPSRDRGETARPSGSPTDERHATETAYQWEDEEHPGQKHPSR